MQGNDAVPDIVVAFHQSKDLKFGRLHVSALTGKAAPFAETYLAGLVKQGGVDESRHTQFLLLIQNQKGKRSPR